MVGTLLSHIIFFMLKMFTVKKLKLRSFFFLPVLGLRCCTLAFSSCSKRGLLFLAVRGLLIAVASLVGTGLGAWASVVAAGGLSDCGSRDLESRLSSCGAQV